MISLILIALIPRAEQTPAGDPDGELVVSEELRSW